MPETELYDPIKAYLMAQGYEVKGEVGAADLVACRGEESPVIVELKTGFTLSLFHQCIERQSVTDLVYLAVPRGHGPRWPRSLNPPGGNGYTPFQGRHYVPEKKHGPSQPVPSVLADSAERDRGGYRRVRR